MSLNSKIVVMICSWGDISWIPDSYDTEYATFTNRKKKETWFRAVQDESLLGVGCLLHISSTCVRHSNDFVLPEHRGKGVIKHIVSARESWAKKNGFKQADVRTVKKYYESMGYEYIRDYKVGGAWYRKDLI